MYDLSQFPIRLKETREKKAWTQKKLADISGVAKSSISHYENYGTMPTTENAIYLAEALCVPLPYLLGEEYIL